MEPLTLSMFSRPQLLWIRAHLVATIGTYAYFWWWLITAMVFSGQGVAWLSSFCLLYACDTAVHCWSVHVLRRALRLNPKVSLPTGRAAMIVTKAPSEPWSVVEATLRGMLAQTVPGVDVWVADEAPTEDSKLWCAENGVHISTRFGLAKYHQPEWPRRTKCKEGNLAYFYDTHAAPYDFVFQFDADHIPQPDYLAKSLPYFSDPAVSYIAFPNISHRCNSWTGRARRSFEATYYGPYQASYGYGADGEFHMPSMTGSHYAVRVADLAKIGGVGPELDEDMATTMMFAAQGFSGAYAIDALADGDGPETFADAVVQEFQWARSALILFTRWRKLIFPRDWQHARLHTVLRMLVIVTWYPLNSLWLMWLVIAPIVVFYRSQCTATGYITLINVALHMCPIGIVSFGLDIFFKRQGLLRSADTPLVSLESLMYRMIRPIWLTCGLLAGALELTMGRTPCFRVTNKGGNEGAKELPYPILLPLFAISGTLLTAVTLGFYVFGVTGNNAIYMFITQCVMAFLYCYIVVRHVAENNFRFPSVRNAMAHVIGLTFQLAFVGVAAFHVRSACEFAPTFVYAADKYILAGVGGFSVLWALGLGLLA